ncbi:hypothetical protein ScPMuIL_016995, partial [Solemya velum]
DWHSFSSLCSLTITDDRISDDVNQFNSSFVSSITDAANAAIPGIKYKQKSLVPWWNEACENAKRKHQHAYNVMKNTNKITDAAEYKRHCAIVKRTTKQVKRS